MAAREPAEDAVERQVRAYNEGDLEEFVACYEEDVVFEDGDGIALMSGRSEMRERYGRLFERSPELHAEILTRIRVGSYIIDEERVTGRPDGDMHAVVVYRLDDDGLIDRVRFLR
jgi:hypothetical protein